MENKQVNIYINFNIDFKKMWSEIHIPDETDLPKALENGKQYNYCSIL